MNTSLPRQVLFDYFDGKATAIQQQVIKEWLADPQHQDLFYQYMDEWESRHPQYMPDSNKALNHLQFVWDKEPSGSVMQPVPYSEAAPTRFIHRYWLSVAASFLLVTGISYYLFQDTIWFRHYRTGYGQTTSFRLTDGTAVTLNANSELTVPRFGFGSKDREVWLNGEGEFSVTHTTDNKRFIVRTATDFQVEVLGTEFVMYARHRQHKVVLNKGKVRVQYPSAKPLIMKPGDLVEVNTRGQLKLARTAHPQQHTAWKDHRFIFDNTSLADIAQLCQDQFGITVRFEDTTLAEKRIAGDFKAQQAGELLEAISALLDLELVSRSDNTILLRPINQP